MLVRYCLSSRIPVTKGVSPSDTGLGGRILRDCATLCVENMQKVISLVDQCGRHSGRVTTDGARMGLVPWWYRIFYLHVAGTVLIAAALQPSLHTQSVSESWGCTMAPLRSHEHLSPFVSQCVATFETLWSRVVMQQQDQQEQKRPQQQQASSSTMHQDPANDPYGFSDITQLMGFHPDEFLFNWDASWVANLDALTSFRSMEYRAG
jgi:hypothetical protein